MPLVTLPSGQLDYALEGAGAPLVLLSANPGDRRDFDAVAPELAQRYQLLRLDWPGYGLSPAPQPPASASAMLFAQLLGELMQQLQLPPAIILGNSVGCYAAVSLALAQPAQVRALVLVSPGGFSPQNAVTRTFCRIKGNEAVTRATN
ncbi:MAG TPA: alpha/beta hydrolase, partial [Nevskiaceae bacterium]|nr:alpha/beta hydrolase [Nevskiaceae bacterium]